MDSFELNKIIGALLAVVFVIFSVNLISHAVFSSPAPETPGYAIAVPEDDGAEEAEAEEEPESVLPLLASADPSAGESVFNRCQACHSVEEGGPNKVGPNLWDIVDAPVARDESFGYSSALIDFSEGGDVTWTYENLDHFLTDPRGFVPGTAMAFAGLGDVQDRADVIAYLRSMSGDPAPLPEAAAEGADGAEGGEASGDGAAASEGDAASEEGGDSSGDEASADGDEAAGDAADGGEAGEDTAAPEEGAADGTGAGGGDAAEEETGAADGTGEGETADEGAADEEQ